MKEDLMKPSISKQLFLVTLNGERHEDRIIVGAYDYDHLCEKYIFDKKRWKENIISSYPYEIQIDCLNNEYDFTDLEKENVRNGIGFDPVCYMEYFTQINIWVIKPNTYFV